MSTNSNSFETKKVNIYQLNEDREKELWSKAIFVFDTSALLDFYFLPLKAREKIFNDFFIEKLENRLWIPAHVKYEYEKKREEIIKKPISEKYKPLKEDNLKKVRTAVKDIENRVKDLMSRTCKDDKHPHLSQEEIEDYYKSIEAFKKRSDDFDEAILKLIKSAEDEINDLPNNDDVAKAIENLFSVGRDYTFSEIIEITKEGKHRYEYSIPPGYEDAGDKIGTQIFGDLIIWKQILEHAKIVNLPIIFICNDLKIDWCYIDKNASEKRISSPREELIKEIYDFAGVEFWMYNQSQFLFNANNYLDAKIEKQNIDDLSHFISAKTEDILSPKTDFDGKLIFKCSRCGHINNYEKDYFDLEFELVGGSERSMGMENEYQHTEYLDCFKCENEINVTFSVWEYPIGVHNYSEVELDGAKLISTFDFSVNFHQDEDDYYQNEEESYDLHESDICAKCGDKFNDTNKTGICEPCEDEYSKS